MRFTDEENEVGCKVVCDLRNDQARSAVGANTAGRDKNEKVNENERAPGMKPRLALYHANAKGTGCAIKMELHPAVGAADGSIFCTFAAQKTIGNRLGPNPTFPTFDWDGAITVKLAFDDLTKIQQVFRGECESINGDHGLWHRIIKGNTRIVLRHLVDPVPGYSLEVYFCPAEVSPELSGIPDDYKGCLDGKSRPVLDASGNIFRPVFSGVP